MNEQHRLDELEMKVAFQEDTINVLSDEIASLNEILDRQRTQLEYIATRIGEMSEQPTGSSQTTEPPPPHY
ncbi:MAG: SlyX family protein [Gammaproteobacteria bacterium]|nr:SlyX family protein [Gammaproteobacteria bacterium]